MSHYDELADFIAKHPANWGITKWTPSPTVEMLPISASLALSEYTHLVLSVGSGRVEAEVFGRGGIVPFHCVWANNPTGPDLMSRIGRRVADAVQNSYTPSVLGLPEWLRPPVREVLLARAALLKAVAEES